MFGSKKKGESELPIPTHLVKIFHPIGDENDELSVKGNIVCECGSDISNLYCNEESINNIVVLKDNSENDLTALKVTCNNCNKDYLVFDSDKHGWDGFVCHNKESDNKEKIFHICECPKCNNHIHKLTVKISSQGKEDFIENSGLVDENDNPLSEEDWVNAFDWIYISNECANCGLIMNEWIEFETM